MNSWPLLKNVLLFKTSIVGRESPRHHDVFEALYRLYNVQETFSGLHFVIEMLCRHYKPLIWIDGPDSINNNSKPPLQKLVWLLIAL